MSSYFRIFHPDPVERAKVMHNIPTAGQWNHNSLEAAKNQFQNPVIGLIESIKEKVSSALRGTLKLGTDIITCPVAAAVNITQWGFDLATKFPARMAVIASDTLSAKTFGKVSMWIRRFKERIYKALETKAPGHAPEALAAA